MNPRNFFAELKRRNVYKVAVGYGVVGWLVMQVAATVVPALHLPDSLTTAVVVLVLLGFPIALVIAWAFEMTPDGMKRTENVSPNEPNPQWSRRKFFTFVAVMALLAAALLGYRSWRTPRRGRRDGRRRSRSRCCRLKTSARTRKTPISPRASRTKSSPAWRRSAI